METKNILILAAVVLGFLVVFSVFKFASPTGGAVAGQNGPVFEGASELVFVDDISCKEWNLCFVDWDTAETETHIEGNETFDIYQLHNVPYADPVCVNDVHLALSGTDLGIDEGDPVPIPPNCLVQKDPTIESINTGDTIEITNITNVIMNITYCAGYPLGDCSILNSLNVTCSDYYNNDGFQCTGSTGACTEGATCQDNGEMEYCFGTTMGVCPPPGTDPPICESVYSFNSVTGAFHNCHYVLAESGSPWCIEYPNSCKPITDT